MLAAVKGLGWLLVKGLGPYPLGPVKASGLGFKLSWGLDYETPGGCGGPPPPSGQARLALPGQVWLAPRRAVHESDFGLNA